MVSWFWILLALSGGFVLGVIALEILSFGREEDAYRDGFREGHREGFEDGVRNIDRQELQDGVHEAIGVFNAPYQGILT